MNISMQQLEKRLPAMTDFDRRMMGGLIKSCTGEITHEQFTDGLAKLFRGQMNDLWNYWQKETLFICQNWNFDKFLTAPEVDVKRDFWKWYEFSRVSELTYDDRTEAFSKVEEYAKKWVIPSFAYRQQFVDENGNPCRTMSNKDAHAELTRLKIQFGAY